MWRKQKYGDVTGLMMLAACLTVWLAGPNSALQAASPMPQGGSVPRPLSRIPAGTVIGPTAPDGWTHLVMLAKPRLGAGDVAKVPSLAVKYASMLNLAILARVGGEPGRRHFEDLAIGFTYEINGRQVVITSETQEALGSNLGWIQKRVLADSEKNLNVTQICRYSTMIVFDAKAIVLWQNEHRDMVLRHLVWVSAQDGRLATAVWLLDPNGGNGYRLAKPTIQILPSNYHEDRVINVKADKFVLGIPTPDAFALVRIPRGKPVQASPALARLAASPRYDVSTARNLAIELNAAIQQETAQQQTTSR